MSWVKLIYQILLNLPSIISAIRDLINGIEEYNRKKKREDEQKAAAQKYDAIASDKSKTAEERAKAYADFINSGRQ